MKGYIELLIIGFGCLIVYNLILKDMPVRESYLNPGFSGNEPNGGTSGYDGNISMYTDPQSGQKSWASPLVYRIEVVQDAEDAQNSRDARNDRGATLDKCSQDKEFITSTKQGMDAIEQRVDWGKKEYARIQPMVAKNTKGIAMNKAIITNISKNAQSTATNAGKGADGLAAIGKPSTPEPTTGGPMAKAIWLFSGGKKSA